MVWWQVVVLSVGLMSGVLAIVREVIGLYSPGQAIPVAKKRFWSCVRIAFILSAAVIIYSEHQKVMSLAVDLTAARQRSAEIDRRPIPSLVTPLSPPIVPLVEPEPPDLTISPEEISRKVDAAPLLRRQAVVNDYVGIHVRWDCDVVGAIDQGQERIRLLMYCGHTEVYAVIRDTPTAKLLRREDKLRITGTISKDSTALSIGLDPAEFTLLTRTK